MIGLLLLTLQGLPAPADPVAPAPPGVFDAPLEIGADDEDDDAAAGEDGASPPPARRPAPRPNVTLEGNLVLADEVYFEVMSLGHMLADRGTNAYDARKLARDVEDFLHFSGYELATVRGGIRDGRIHLVIDEGRLSRILFRGQGDIRTIQLKLIVNIPHQIYNRPLIARQLEGLKGELAVDEISMRLVPTAEVEHVGPQMQQLGGMEEVAGIYTIPPPGEYELDITLGQKDWSTGLGIIIDLKPPDGLLLGAAYSGSGLITSDDRWFLRGAVGGNLFSPLNGGGSYVDLSRATATASWGSPPLFLGLRPTIVASTDLMTRARPDLAIETYRLINMSAVLAITYDLTRSIRLGAGVGALGRWLFDLHQSPVPGQRTRRGLDSGFWLTTFDGYLLFDPDNPRLDRRHELWLQARLTYGSDPNARLSLRSEYQKYFPLGWHDVAIKARAIGEWGSVHFFDEESVAWLTRSVFGGRHWTRAALGLIGEGRFSIIRDVFKAGVFTDLALFEKPGRSLGGSRIMVATAFGPSLHFLILDTIQADFYYSFGLDSDGVFEHGFSGVARKAF